MNFKKISREVLFIFLILGIISGSYFIGHTRAKKTYQLSLYEQQANVERARKDTEKYYADIEAERLRKLKQQEFMNLPEKEQYKLIRKYQEEQKRRYDEYMKRAREWVAAQASTTQ